MAITRNFHHAVTLVPVVSAQAYAQNFVRTLLNGFIQDDPLPLGGRRKNLIDILELNTETLHMITVPDILDEVKLHIPAKETPEGNFHFFNCERLKCYIEECQRLLPSGMNAYQVAAEGLKRGNAAFSASVTGNHATMNE